MTEWVLAPPTFKSTVGSDNLRVYADWFSGPRLGIQWSIREEEMVTVGQQED